MTTAIVYFHGLDSNPTSRTSSALREAFDGVEGCKFYCPHINHRAPFGIIADQLNELIDNLSEDPTVDDIILVGSSAGGFWARNFGTTHGLKTVLVNPSIYSSKNLLQFGFDPVQLEIYDTVEQNLGYKMPTICKVVVGQLDTVIDPAVVSKFTENVQILEGEGHVLTELSPIINIVRNFVGNFPEYGI